MTVNVKEARGSCKNVKTLTDICQSFILKYTHHAVWRQLDPPNPLHHEEFRPHNFPMRAQLPLARGTEDGGAEETETFAILHFTDEMFTVFFET